MENPSYHLDDTSPDEMDKDVSDRNDDKNEEIDEVKEAECLDDTSPDGMEEGLSDLKMTGVKKMTREQRLNAYMTPPLTIWRNM